MNDLREHCGSPIGAMRLLCELLLLHSKSLRAANAAIDLACSVARAALPWRGAVRLND
jgi:hypothetical protein